MKRDIVSRIDVTDIKSDTLSLWLSVTGLKPVRVEIKSTPETDNDFKMFKLTASLGGSPYRNIDKIIFEKLVTDNQSVKSTSSFDLSQSDNKEALQDLWERINKIIYYTGECCICGIKKQSNSWRAKTCGSDTCRDVRNFMYNHIKKLQHQIKMDERIGICDYCKEEYPMKRKDSHFCTGKCRVANFRKSLVPTLSSPKEPLQNKSKISPNLEHGEPLQ